MILSVTGRACIGSFGASPEALFLDEALSSTDGLARSVDTTLLKEKCSPRIIRQMDHFSRMALLCAIEALESAELFPVNGPRSDIGIILASGYGPATPTFSFLDSILAHGEVMASPLAFSHSVHNIPAASIAIALGLGGPCSTVCMLDAPFTAALITAKLWLAEGRVRHVLVGVADEATGLLARTSSRLARESGKIPQAVSDACAFLCLSAEREENVCGYIVDMGYTNVWEPPLPTPGKDAPLLLVSGAKTLGESALTQGKRLERLYGKTPAAQGLDVVFSLLCPTLDHNTAYCLSYTSRGTVGFIATQRTL